MITRRTMLKASATALLAAGMWPGRLRAADTATKPLKFIQVNDLHYFDDLCAPFFEGMVAKMNTLEPAFVLIVGDLVDEGKSGQCHAIHDILRSLKAPYFVTPGNHDHLTQTDRGPFESVFGQEFNVWREENGWQFVGLDSSDGILYEKVSVKQPTLDFVASLPSKLDKNKPTFIYTHFPLGPGVQYELVNAKNVLEPLKELNIAAIFNGHFHGFTEKKVLSDRIVTTNRCCARKRTNHDNTWQKGFFVIEAADGKWKRTFVEYGTDLANSAKPSGRRPQIQASTQPADPSRPSY
ncbi:MAG TPA: metallophosphoesterase [Phycisphaerae bacterium]|nr:metallophosphoesterase [Phycisphaerae bacterium]